MQSIGASGVWAGALAAPTCPARVSEFGVPVSLWVDGIAMLEHADPDVGWATAGPAPVSVVANTPAATKATSGLASLVVAVEATGGAMDFAERPGGGTLVTVTIPDELNQG